MNIVTPQQPPTIRPEESNSLALASAIVEQLAYYEIHELNGTLLPLIAAAAAELTSELGLDWRTSADDAAAMLVRIIARAALLDPTAGGDHCVALFERLTALDTRSPARCR